MLNYISRLLILLFSPLRVLITYLVYQSEHDLVDKTPIKVLKVNCLILLW